MSSPARPAHRSRLVSLVLAFAMTSILSNSTYSQSRSDPSSSRSLPISPAVWAEWSTHVDPVGAAILEFLVLLRGEPGFFMRGMSTHRSGPAVSVTITGSDHILVESPPGPSDFHLTFGPHSVKGRFDPVMVTLTVEDEVVSLQAVNVVLVDGVDSADGIWIENVFWVDPQLPYVETSVIDLVRKEPAIFPFLRCEAKIEHAALQRQFDDFCNRMMPE